MLDWIGLNWIGLDWIGLDWISTSYYLNSYILFDFLKMVPCVIYRYILICIEKGPSGAFRYKLKTVSHLLKVIGEGVIEK